MDKWNEIFKVYIHKLFNYVTAVTTNCVLECYRKDALQLEHNQI